MWFVGKGLRSLVCGNNEGGSLMSKAVTGEKIELKLCLMAEG